MHLAGLVAPGAKRRATVARLALVGRSRRDGSSSSVGRSGSSVGGGSSGLCGGIGGGFGGNGGRIDGVGRGSSGLGGRFGGGVSGRSGLFLIRAGGQSQRNGNGAQSEFDFHQQYPQEKNEWKETIGTNTTQKRRLEQPPEFRVVAL